MPVQFKAKPAPKTDVPAIAPTVEKIASWRHGFAGFEKFIADVGPLIPSHKGGFQPFAFPNERVREEVRKALDGNFGTVVFCWPRRHGKTVTAAVILYWRFLTRQTQQIGMLANSQEQAEDTAFKLFRSMVERTPYSRDLIAKKQIQITAESLAYPALGSAVQIFPGGVAALYGRKLSVAQVSEYHAAKSDSGYQTLASSTVDSSDGLVLIDSTAGAKSSPLFALYQVAERGDDPSLFFSYIEYENLEDAIENGPSWIDPVKLRSRAAQMLPAEFEQQHLNKWGGATNALFPSAILDRCRDSYPADPVAIANGAAFVVGAGLDRAFGFSQHGDATVCTAVLKTVRNEDVHYFVLASERVAFSSAAGIRSAFTRYRDRFGCRHVAIESYNSQDIASWCEEQRFSTEIVHPTVERQAGAFTALFNAAAEGRLHIDPACKALFEEMAVFGYWLESGGTRGTIPKFGHPAGHHDDHVYSLAWAIYSLREIELNPYELDGVSCNAPAQIAALCVLNGSKLEPPCADTCKSMMKAREFYSKFVSMSQLSPLGFADFVSLKIKNTGSHTLRR